MQTRSSLRLVSNPSSNPTPSTNANPKGHNRRRSKQRIEEFNLDELSPPIITMADQRTMAQLLQAPTEPKRKHLPQPKLLPNDCSEFLLAQTSLLIQGLPNDIYSLIDSNKTGKDLWDALVRHMLGSEYGEQDRKVAVLYEYETFKATEGELLLDTYIRYLQVINDLKKCGYSKDNCELNFKFLNNLQPEWKQYVAMMRQNKNLMDINIDALYNILKQNQGDVNEAMGSKKKTIVVTSDPLALIAKKTNVSRSKDKVVVSSDSEGSEADDFTEDQAWMESSSDSNQEINANMVFMVQIEKVLFDSKASSSSADEKIFKTDGEVMINLIKNGDQPLPRVTQVSIARTTSTEKPHLKEKSMWSDQEKRIQKIDRLARSLLIQGLSNDIYSLIDSNKTGKDLWDALVRHMLGSEYGEQDMKAAVLYESVAIPRINCELNFKFLNNLQPEWKQYATMMRQNKNLMDINIDALYNILKQNQGDVNEAMGSKKKTVVVTSDPLALIAEKTNVSRSKDEVVVSSDSEGSEADDFSELRKDILPKTARKQSSSSADEKISKVSYYLSESESESEFKTLEYYDNSTNYGLFVNNDDDQEIFHDVIESASENFIENHIDSQKDYDKSDVDHNDSEEKDHLVDNLI
nr:hypothetical protein [Tanacetum cinerariifolium]